MLKIVIFLGTAREGNYSQYAAKLILHQVEQDPDLEVTMFDPASLGLKATDENQGDKFPELRAAIEAADGFIIVSPEYNHGYPGSLKMMLDLNLKAYQHKPVALCGVSSGVFGGARAIEVLNEVVRKLRLVSIADDVNFSQIQDEVKDGQFVDQAKWIRRSERMLSELKWMARALKTAREQDQNDQ